MGETKLEEMKKIRDEVWDLTSSPLYKYRKENNYYPVLGEGSHDAGLMFIGEAPGENEAKTGKPFCGRAGTILDEMLKLVGIPRAEVYVTNIVKDRPPGNRDPEPSEIEIYGPFLDRQISVIKPKAVATLGRFSMEYIMTRYGLAWEIAPIGKIHGEVFMAKMPYGEALFVPLYHPAAAIYNRATKDHLQMDFKKLKKLLDEKL